jgi:hypothetical protein
VAAAPERADGGTSRAPGPALLALALGGLLSVLSPEIARAHAAIDDARRLYEDADFEQALAALDRAEASTDLTRDDVVEMLRLRAELHLALGDVPSMELDVLQLLEVDPSARIPASAPPEMRDAAERARDRTRGPLAIDATAVPSASGVTIEARPAGDPGGLIARIEVHARVGDGAWSGPSAPPATIALPPGERVAYYAEAIGPGGATLVHAGTRDEPRTWGGELAAADRETPSGGVSDEVWIGIGIGAGVVVLATIVIVAVVASQPSGPSDRTRPQLPVIVSF